jgi:predicted MFS family arabinose efflux permease
MLICLLIGGYLSDKYGRRLVCMSGISLNVIVSIIIVFPKSFIVFIACRIFIGFGAGIVTKQQLHHWCVKLFKRNFKKSEVSSTETYKELAYFEKAKGVIQTLLFFFFFKFIFMF